MVDAFRRLDVVVGDGLVDGGFALDACKLPGFPLLKLRLDWVQVPRVDPLVDLGDLLGVFQFDLAQGNSLGALQPRHAEGAQLLLRQCQLLLRGAQLVLHLGHRRQMVQRLHVVDLLGLLLDGLLVDLDHLLADLQHPARRHGVLYLGQALLFDGDLALAVGVDLRQQVVVLALELVGVVFAGLLCLFDGFSLVFEALVQAVQQNRLFQPLLDRAQGSGLIGRVRAASGVYALGKAVLHLIQLPLRGSQLVDRAVCRGQLSIAVARRLQGDTDFLQVTQLVSNFVLAFLVASAKHILHGLGAVLLRRLFLLAAHGCLGRHGVLLRSADHASTVEVITALHLGALVQELLQASIPADQFTLIAVRAYRACLLDRSYILSLLLYFCVLLSEGVLQHLVVAGQRRRLVFGPAFPQSVRARVVVLRRLPHALAGVIHRLGRRQSLVAHLIAGEQAPRHVSGSYRGESDSHWAGDTFERRQRAAKHGHTVRGANGKLADRRHGSNDLVRHTQISGLAQLGCHERPSQGRDSADVLHSHGSQRGQTVDERCQTALERLVFEQVAQRRGQGLDRRLSVFERADERRLQRRADTLERLLGRVPHLNGLEGGITGSFRDVVLQLLQEAGHACARLGRLVAELLQHRTHLAHAALVGDDVQELVLRRRGHAVHGSRHLGHNIAQGFGRPVGVEYLDIQLLQCCLRLSGPPRQLRVHLAERGTSHLALDADLRQQAEAGGGIVQADPVLRGCCGRRAERLPHFINRSHRTRRRFGDDVRDVRHGVDRVAEGRGHSHQLLSRRLHWHFGHFGEVHDLRQSLHG